MIDGDFTERGSIPAFLIVPFRESDAGKLGTSPDLTLWRHDRMRAFLSWEKAASYSRKKWRKKTHFLILDGIALDDEQVKVRKENGDFWIEGKVYKRHALNLGIPTRRQVSSGGVLCYRTDGGSHLALIQVDRNGILRWEIPKGKIRRRESAAQAALREVREETGIGVPVSAGPRIGQVDYMFRTEDRRLYFKSVYYYLLDAESEGPLTPRSEERIMDARWFTSDNACEIVSFPNLRPILRRAVAGSPYA